MGDGFECDVPEDECAGGICDDCWHNRDADDDEE